MYRYRPFETTHIFEKADQAYDSKIAVTRAKQPMGYFYITLPWVWIMHEPVSNIVYCKMHCNFNILGDRVGVVLTRKYLVWSLSNIRHLWRAFADPQEYSLYQRYTLSLINNISQSVQERHHKLHPDTNALQQSVQCFTPAAGNLLFGPSSHEEWKIVRATLDQLPPADFKPLTLRTFKQYKS